MRKERFNKVRDRSSRLRMGGRFPAQFGAESAFVYAQHEQVGLAAIESVSYFEKLIARRAVYEALTYQRCRAVTPAFLRFRPS